MCKSRFSTPAGSRRSHFSYCSLPLRIANGILCRADSCSLSRFSALRWLYCSPPELLVCGLSLICGRLAEARRAHAGACLSPSQNLNARFSVLALGAIVGHDEHINRTRKGGNDLDAHPCGLSDRWYGGAAIALPNPASALQRFGATVVRFAVARAQSFSFGLFSLVCVARNFSCFNVRGCPHRMAALCMHRSCM